MLELAVESLDPGLERCDLVAEGDEDVGERVVDRAGVGDEDALALLVDDVRWDADDGGVGRDVAEDDRAGTDAGAFADDDVAEDVGVVADEDSVAEGGVAFASGLAGAAEGDGLVQRDVVADDGGFADDDADAVVDEEAAADLGGGVDLDSGPEAGALGAEAGEQLEVVAPEPVLDVVGPDGVEAGIAENHHEPRGGGGIALEDGADVFADGLQKVHAVMMIARGGWSLRMTGYRWSRDGRERFALCANAHRLPSAMNEVHGEGFVLSRFFNHLFNCVDDELLRLFRADKFDTLAGTLIDDPTRFRAPYMRVCNHGELLP